MAVMAVAEALSAMSEGGGGKSASNGGGRGGDS